jgi:hypothetical protein
MDVLELLVREAVQNSWDAREDPRQPVLFGIAAADADKLQASLLREIFSEIPPGLRLHEVLRAQPIRLLAVFDRGTVGLEGPTRADRQPKPGEATNFVNFLRYVGHTSGRVFAGGTYGFGKAAFFLASRARTICVHSRCRVASRLEDRFIAVALGSEYSQDGRKYTGRHWWGRRAEDGVVDPVVGSAAWKLAVTLGIPEYPAGGRGTTIFVVAPDYGDRSLREALDSIQDTILRYFWPKMIDGDDGRGTMEFRLTLNGARIDIPHPSKLEGLKGFVSAFHGFTGARVDDMVYSSRLEPIVCQRPAQKLGTLSLIARPPKGIAAMSEGSSDLQDGTEDPLRGPCRYVALLRAPNFVVRYLQGPAVAFDQIEYAGVFRAERDVDSIFARAEPPTHDDWVADSLELAHERTFVRVTQRRIRDAMEAFATPTPVRSGTDLQVPLGDFSSQLGGLVTAAPGTGADVSGTKAPSGGDRQVRSSQRAARTAVGARVRVREGEHVELLQGIPAFVIEFDVEDIPPEGAEICADASVVIEGGGVEGTPPLGSEVPSVLEWRGPAGRVVRGSPELKLTGVAPQRWAVAVRMPADAMIGVSVRLKKPISQ